MILIGIIESFSTNKISHLFPMHWKLYFFLLYGMLDNLIRNRSWDSRVVSCSGCDTLVTISQVGNMRFTKAS